MEANQLENFYLGVMFNRLEYLDHQNKKFGNQANYAKNIGKYKSTLYFIHLH